LQYIFDNYTILFIFIQLLNNIMNPFGVTVIYAARPGALPRDLISIPCGDKQGLLLLLLDLYKGAPERVVYLKLGYHPND